MNNTNSAQQFAKQILDGFNRHYKRFRECAQQAKIAFEQQDWAQSQRLVGERVAFYDERVNETVEHLQNNAPPYESSEFWHEVKNHYVECLMEHHQPECAETFLIPC